MLKQSACRIAALALACAVSCGPPPDGRSDAEVSGPAAACPVGVSDAGVLTVGGEPVGIRWAGEGPVEARAWRGEDGGHLVAFRPDRMRLKGPEPDGRLYAIGCGGDPDRRPLLSRPGADFGYAAMAPDGRTLYFTDAQGVSALDLETREVSPITVAPLVDEDCWAAARGDERPRRVDVVVGLEPAADVLTFHRGGYCGYEGDWTAREHRILHVGDPARRRVEAVQPVSEVAVDASGHLWLGDAGRCDEPGVLDPSTPGHVWRSRDQGDSWERIPVRAPEQPMVTAAERVIADREEPGRILVYSAVCTSAAATLGGSAFLTEDGGASWSMLRIPDALADAHMDVGQGLAGAGALGPGLGAIVVWGGDGEAWVSPDDGVTWLPHPGEVPRRASKRVSIGGGAFRATTRGLLREDRDGAQRVFPPGDAPP